MFWGTQRTTCPCKTSTASKSMVSPAPKAQALQQPLLSLYIDLTLFCRAINSADRLVLADPSTGSPLVLVSARLGQHWASFVACETAIQNKHMRDLSNKAGCKIIRVEIKCQHLLYNEPHLSWQISDPQLDKREEVAPNFSALAMTKVSLETSLESI